MICLFPNSIHTLAELQRKGIRMALVTNGTSKDQREKILRFGLEGFFEAIFIEEEVGFGKPDVRIYKQALEALKLQPQDVWMVGDNLIWDVQAPQSIGIHSIWNDYQGTGLPKGSSVMPDRIVNGINELINNG